MKAIIMGLGLCMTLTGCVSNQNTAQEASEFNQQQDYQEEDRNQMMEMQSTGN